MKHKIMSFWVKHHILTNLITVAIIVGGIASWFAIPKEELPDITFDRVRVSAGYPGASAQEIEYYVTQPLEEAVASLDGIYSISSSASTGQTSVNIELERDVDDKDALIADIRNQVLDVKLPADVIDEPSVRVFKTARKAIIDIGIYLQGERLLDVQARQKLQKYARVLENRLLSLKEVSEVSFSGYLDEELRIEVDPALLVDKKIPLSTIKNSVKNANVRQPAGMLDDERESRVNVRDELDNDEKLAQVAVEGGFEGQVLRLDELADISYGFEEEKSITKVNGHEAIFIRVTKSSNVGIIDAVDAVKKSIAVFDDKYSKANGVRAITLDDESVEIRNRLSIVGTNAILGFVLIVIVLLLFLDKRSSLWVALGIPFTFCLSLVGAYLLGYSINNVTLSAIILVMGMVVDDAIVVAENISRLRRQGVPLYEASIEGTASVMLPVAASILTTCVAFIPLFYFGGFFGYMMRFMPPVIFLMLGASLFESVFILPGHVTLFSNKHKDGKKQSHWFDEWENRYELFLTKILNYKWFILLGFFVVLLLTVFMATKMRFVMFPDEETKEVFVIAGAPKGTPRLKTAKIAEKLEDIVSEELGSNVVGYRTSIARSRRGRAVEENKFRMNIEVKSRDDRNKSLDDLVDGWEQRFKDVDGLKDVRLAKTRYGAHGGSPIEVVIKENDDLLRQEISEALVEALSKYDYLENIEIDAPAISNEYNIELMRDKMKRLAINPSDVATTLRTALEGSLLYEVKRPDDELKVRLTLATEHKDNIENILSMPVENNRDYLVPLQDIVKVNKVKSPDSLEREDSKRISKVFADIKSGYKVSPLEIATVIENEVFADLTDNYPTAILDFAGEVEHTRETQAEIGFAVIAVLFLIYVILAVLFDSLSMPLLVMLAIPFGLCGVLIAFRLHGIEEVGFFAAIGMLGLAGVVVNDSIIMLVRIKDAIKKSKGDDMLVTIAAAAKTRLRAVILTTVTTVAGMFPTAYGFAGYDSMLSQMMLAVSWGLLFATFITLLLVPTLFAVMDMLKKKVKSAVGLAALIMFLSLSLAYADDSNSLSYKDFIEEACKQDTVFEEILKAQYKISYRDAIKVDDDAWFLKVKSQLNYNLDPDNNSKESLISLDKLFPLSGTSLSASYFANPDLSGDSKSSKAAFTLSQDIAENAFGKSQRLNKDLASIEKDLARFQIVEAYEQYYAKLMESYFDWYAKYHAMITAKAAYDENLKLLENMRERKKNNVAYDVDVNKIELLVLEKQAKYLETKNQYSQVYNKINNAMRREQEVTIVPEALPDYSLEAFDDLWTEFESESRTAELLALLYKEKKTAASILVDDLLPSIKLFAKYSSEGDDYELVKSESMIAGGLEFAWPIWGSKKEKAKANIARIEEEVQALGSSNAMVDLKLSFMNLYVAISANEELIDLAAQKVEIAGKVLKDEQENYSYGRISLNDLIKVVNDLDQKKYDKIVLETQLAKLNLELCRLSDKLLTVSVLDN